VVEPVEPPPVWANDKVAPRNSAHTNVNSFFIHSPLKEVFQSYKV